MEEDTSKAQRQGTAWHIQAIMSSSIHWTRVSATNDATEQDKTWMALYTTPMSTDYPTGGNGSMRASKLEHVMINLQTRTKVM